MDGQCLVSIFKRLGFEIALYHGDVSLEEGKSHLIVEGQRIKENSQFPDYVSLSLTLSGSNIVYAVGMAVVRL